MLTKAENAFYLIKKKYSKNSNLVKYYYNLKCFLFLNYHLFPMLAKLNFQHH